MKKITIAILMLAALTACKKQEFYEVPTMPGTDTPIENPTQLTVTTHEESSVTEDITVHLLTADGTEVEATFEPGTTVDVEAGKYIILKANDPWEGATFNAPVVTLATAAGRASDTFVSSAPDIHAGHEIVTLDANEHHEYEIALEHYTRKLRFSVTLSGLTPESLSSVSYGLTGARTSISLIKPFGPDASTGSATLTGRFDAPATDADGNLSATAEVRLLGLDLTAPQLTVTATLADGSTQSVTLDATRLLAGFYRLAADEFIELRAILSFGIEGMTGSIEGWTPGWDEDVEGN